MAKLLTRRVFRETQLLKQRSEGDRPRPVMIEFSNGQISVWLKGTHQRFTLTLEDLYEFARGRQQAPLLTFAELEQEKRQRMQSALP